MPVDDEIFKSPGPSVKDIARRLDFQSQQLMSPTPKKSNTQTTKTNTPADSLHVYLRIRPNPSKNVTPAAIDMDDGVTTVYRVEESVQMLDNQNVAFHTSKSTEEEKYSFQKVFGHSSTQEEVFETTTKPLIDGVFDGTDALLFAYGVTNAGKTYTIMGKIDYERGEDDTTSKVNMESGTDGIIPRAMQDLFNRINSSNNYGVMVSYYELYQDRIYDLLSTSEAELINDSERRKPLKIAEERGRVVIKDLTQLPISSPDEGKELLMRGNKNRQVSKTELNRDSSRSHAIFTLSLVKRLDGDLLSPVAKLSIVDLAGLERASKTNAQGSQLKEAGSINKSLLTLARCLSAIAEKQKTSNCRVQIPYRESEFTKIFKNEFNGHARLCMVVNVSPDMKDAEETAGVLRYAQTARAIKVTARIPMLPLVPSASKSAGFLSPRLYVPKTPSTAVTSSRTRSALQKKNIAASARILHYSDDTTNIPNAKQEIDPQMLEELKKMMMSEEMTMLVKAELESVIRDEMADEIDEQMLEMERDHKSNLQTMLQLTEEKYLRVIDHLQKETGVSDDVINELQEQVKCLEMAAKLKDNHIMTMSQEMERLQEIADKLNTEEDILSTKEKLRLIREIDEKSDEAAQYKKYQRENEFLTGKVTNLEEQISKMQRDHEEEIKRMTKENQQQLTTLRHELTDQYLKEKEQFETETKDRYYNQFEAKYQNHAEELKKEMRMLEHKYEQEASEKKLLLESLKNMKKQAEEQQQKIAVQNVNSPKKSSLLVTSIKKSVSKLIHSPRSVGSPKLSQSSSVPCIPLHIGGGGGTDSLRKQALTGKKRKSDQIENDENSSPQSSPKSSQQPFKKPRIEIPTEPISPSKLSPKSPLKVQTTNKDQSPVDTKPSFMDAEKPKILVASPKRANTVSSPKKASPSPTKPVRTTRTRTLRLNSANTKHLLGASPDLKVKAVTSKKRAKESDDEDVVSKRPKRTTRRTKAKDIESSDESDNDDKDGAYQPSPSPKPVRRTRRRRVK